MKILKVPYAEKDQAKALGARWNAERKTWYVPDGQPTAPFEQWLVGAVHGSAGATAKPAARVDAHAGVPVVGAMYVALSTNVIRLSTAPNARRCSRKAGGRRHTRRRRPCCGPSD
jgi:hypothetical protein